MVIPLPSSTSPLEYQRSMQRWLSAMGWNYFVTFNFNTHTTLESGRTTMKRFHAKLDRTLYGRNFNTLTVHERTAFIAFPEHVDSNLHYHAMLHTRNPDFSSTALKSWSSIIPSGTLHIVNLKESGTTDHINISRYITKELLKTGRNESFIISGEFSSR
jgi:hypothetical protein